jgi:hypothetical protein
MLSFQVLLTSAFTNILDVSTFIVLALAGFSQLRNEQTVSDHRLLHLKVWPTAKRHSAACARAFSRVNQYIIVACVRNVRAIYSYLYGRCD